METNKYLTGINLVYEETAYSIRSKWYPSLSEGWVEGYILKLKNTGCTKINREDLTIHYFISETLNNDSLKTKYIKYDII